MNVTAGTITTTISAASYHADTVADVPTLSASIASILCSKTPLHAWTAHPKLNPNFKREEKAKFDVGTVVHALLLERRSVAEVVAIVDAADWRTNAAKEAREQARLEGKIPLLAAEVENVKAMLEAAGEQLRALDVDPPAFDDGLPERTLVWEEDDGVVCRARLDWLRDDYATIDDFKTTSGSANPDHWTRTLFQIGADVQVAFYRRGVERLTGEVPEFRYFVQETYPPYALCPVSLAPSALEIAASKVEWAIARWALCLRRGVWAGYPTDICFAEIPSFVETSWLEKEARDA